MCVRARACVCASITGDSVGVEAFEVHEVLTLRIRRLRDVDVGDICHGHRHFFVRVAGRVLAAVSRVDGECGAFDVAHDDVLVADVVHVAAAVSLCVQPTWE